jgi:hypothetical protein
MARLSESGRKLAEFEVLSSMKTNGGRARVAWLREEAVTHLSQGQVVATLERLEAQEFVVRVGPGLWSLRNDVENIPGVVCAGPVDGALAPLAATTTVTAFGLARTVIERGVATVTLENHGTFKADLANVEQVLSTSSRWTLAQWVAAAYEYYQHTEHAEYTTPVYWNRYGKIALAVIALDLGYIGNVNPISNPDGV